MSGQGHSLAELEVSGADVLNEVRDLIVRYVVFPSDEAADAVTLYAAASYAATHANFAPRLIVKSPVKRCGKTRLIVDVLGQLVHAPLTAVSLSPAALVHSIDPGNPPTIILDETDTVFGKGGSGDERTELLRGILNSGFTRGVPYVRWDAQTRSKDECPTFAMAVLGGIDNGKMPDTIEDRAVIITLRRKTPGESVQRFRTRRDGPKVRAVSERLGDWVSAHAEELGEAEPELPEALNDRAMDVWEPLLAVADLAGGDWPERARHAALLLSGAAEDDAAESQRLMADLRDVFGEAHALHTAAILDSLHKIEEAPWGNWYGHPLADRELARLLKPYGVKSRDVKIADVNRKGYYAADLSDAWQRYLPARPCPGGVALPSATRATAQVSGHISRATEGLPVGYPENGDQNQVALGSARVAEAETPLTREVAQVAPGSATPRNTDHPGNANAVSLLPYRRRSGDSLRCAASGQHDGPAEQYRDAAYCPRHAKMMGAA